MKTDDDEASGQTTFGTDPKPYYFAFGVLVVLELLHRLFGGFVPDDLTAYMAGADAFVSGANPYIDFTGARFTGKPFVYLPGTLYLFAPLALLPTFAVLALDYVARMTALFFAIRWLGRRILPDAPPQLPWVLAFAHMPLVMDVMLGNFASYLFAAWVGCAYLAEQSPTSRRILGAASCGVVLAVKPFWLPAAAYCFLLRRNWRGLGGLTVGALAVGALTLLHVDWLPDYFAMVDKIRAFYFTVDFLNLAPPMLAVAAIAWAGGAWILGRRGDPDLSWIFAAACLPAFPRLSTYSYVLVLPMIFLLVRRWGALRACLYACVMLGPIPYLLRAAPWVPGSELENGAQFVWTIVTGFVVFRLLDHGGNHDR